MTHATVCTTCFQTECEVLFQPSLFSAEDRFFSLCQRALMLWPYAGGGRVDNRAQCCRRRPSASAALSPRLPLQLSLPMQGHRPASVRATGCTGVPGRAGPPCFYPNTFRSHPPHTAPLCAPNLRPLPTKKTLHSWLAAAQRSGCHSLTPHATY